MAGWGWVGYCPVCGPMQVRGVPLWRGSWALDVAPRMARHLWLDHPYETVALLLAIEIERRRLLDAEPSS